MAKEKMRRKLMAFFILIFFGISLLCWILAKQVKSLPQSFLQRISFMRSCSMCILYQKIIIPNSFLSPSSKEDGRLLILHMGKLRHGHTSLHPETTLFVWTLTPMGRFSKMKARPCKEAERKLDNVAQVLEMLICHCTIYYQ